MTRSEAIAWLRAVDGELYRTPPGRRGRRATGGTPQQRIIALGETVQEAASSAAAQWRAVFTPRGRLH
jgi:hypothetical protein